MRLKDTIAARLAPFRRIAIWGAGGLGRTALRAWLPRDKVVRLIDANPAKWGSSVFGIGVAGPDDGVPDGVDAVVICTSARRSAKSALRNTGYSGPCLYIYELFPGAGDAAMGDIAKLKIDLVATKNCAWLLLPLHKPQVLVNVSFRLAAWASRKPIRAPVYAVMFALHWLACLLTSIQLPIGTQIGPGLVFAHFGTIVFTQRARIGSFFTIYHGCTVGTDDSGDAPEIGDFVYQYAGSHVLGKSKIGRNCRIGANAVAIGVEAPDGSTLVGLPARIVTPKEGAS